MIIKEKNSDAFVPYHEIGAGDVFRYHKNLYLATDEFCFHGNVETEKINAVNIKDGNFVYVPYDDKVEIVKGCFQVE